MQNMLINQLTHKTMSLLILEITNKGLFTLSVLPWENRQIKNKKFPGTTQSNNGVSAGFNHLKFYFSGDGCF